MLTILEVLEAKVTKDYRLKNSSNQHYPKSITISVRICKIWT